MPLWVGAILYSESTDIVIFVFYTDVLQSPLKGRRVSRDIYEINAMQAYFIIFDVLLFCFRYRYAHEKREYKSHYTICTNINRNTGAQTFISN